MAGFSDYDSAGTHKFGFTLDGIESKTIKAVEGLSSSWTRSRPSPTPSTARPSTRCGPATGSILGELTVTRVMTDDPSWDLWFNTAVKDVKAARKNGVVTIYNQEYLPDPGVQLQERLADLAQGHRHERRQCQPPSRRPSPSSTRKSRPPSHELRAGPSPARPAAA